MEYSHEQAQGLALGGENMSYAPTGITESDLSVAAPLGAGDLCDSCGAQAYVRVTLPTGELLFCGHHAAKHRASLGDKVISWHDETSKLRDS
jgi:hypothetical protein